MVRDRAVGRPLLLAVPAGDGRPVAACLSVCSFRALKIRDSQMGQRNRPRVPLRGSFSSANIRKCSGSDASVGLPGNRYAGSLLFLLFIFSCFLLFAGRFSSFRRFALSLCGFYTYLSLFLFCFLCVDPNDFPGKFDQLCTFDRRGMCRLFSLGGNSFHFSVR